MNSRTAAVVIRFKYMSQNTFDRPSASYLVEVVKRLVDELK